MNSSPATLLTGASRSLTDRVTAPGTVELWMRRHGKSGGQSKMPRSDCEIADELAAIESAE